MKMNRVTVTVALGSFIQGWFYLLLTGYPSYIKEEFNLGSETENDSLVWILSMVGMLSAGICIGKGMGYRSLFVISSLMYMFCSIVMLWSRYLSLTLVLWFVCGFPWGFSYVVLGVYALSTAPQGFMSHWFPQLACLCGICLCFIVAKMPLVNWPGWRLIFEVAFILSLAYYVLVLYLLETPQWLVKKGRIDEARKVLQILLDCKYVSDETALEVFGLRLGGGGSTEEDYNDVELAQCGPTADNLSKPRTLSTVTQQGNVEESSTREAENSTSEADASLLTVRIAN